MTRIQPNLKATDPAAVFARLTGRTAKFRDDLSPAEVTDVLVSFAFIVGLNVGAADLAFAAVLLSRIEDEMPAASAEAELVARSLEQPLPRQAGREAA